MTQEFRPDTIRLTKELSDIVKKKNGIYCTPKSIRDQLFTCLNNLQPQKILEPSFGSGEFLFDLLERFPNSDITGVEFNQTLFQSISSDKIHLIHQDFSTFTSTTKYDLIIGNPPYVVVKTKETKCMKGRGNLFVLFIYWCLTRHLAPNGYLTFVLPTSFLNCSYYEPCRQYIFNHCSVIQLILCSSFKWLDTSQSTMILILQNRPENTDIHSYFIQKHGLFLTPYYKEIQILFNEGKTLQELGFNVKTGSIVWNQNKQVLTDNPNDVLLLYETNLTKNNGYMLNNIKQKAKKQYIPLQTKKPIQEPCLVIARGFGNQYQLRYAYIPKEIRFYGENHVNIITSPNQDELLIKKLTDSLKDERTLKFIQMFTGNGALSKTDIQSVVPFFIEI